MTNAISETYGKIRTWEEVQVFATDSSFIVWAAGAGTPPGPVHRGYGKSEQAAVVDLLRELEVARQDGSGPQTVVVDEYPRLDLDDLFSAAPRPTLVPQPGTIESYFPTPAPGAARPEYKDLPDEFWDEIDGGQKIRAIKILRDTTRLSLRSAKDIVDSIQNRRYVRD